MNASPGGERNTVDISDTLPGVTIAISLVPPLSVVGVTLESGAYAQAGGAALLFLTDVAAILVTGIVVMGIYGVRAPDRSASAATGAEKMPRRALITIITMVIAIGIPLTLATIASTSAALRTGQVQQITRDWLSDTESEMLGVTTGTDSLKIRVTGPDPAPSTIELAKALSEAGIDVEDVEVELIPSITRSLGS
ncbi:DUF389 domain-containing protein [Leucobacter triazinivorans]|uniref:DUF389 domain-containing protein n=1 Tax=Leucobacter triazinivorans TaxID=1784719 RepID=A0A4P6KFE7_9MICO|nr:DUF389 domain-containing protein [Leucobacter triazinivorans]QBE48880.1 DUF389 domain-containing protein [Leucobacter triazinivorans]